LNSLHPLGLEKVALCSPDMLKWATRERVQEVALWHVPDFHPARSDDGKVRLGEANFFKAKKRRQKTKMKGHDRASSEEK